MADYLPMRPNEDQWSCLENEAEVPGNVSDKSFEINCLNSNEFEGKNFANQWQNSIRK